MSSIRVRRVAPRWPWRRRYEIEVRDEDGDVIITKKTADAAGFLSRSAGVHTTDSHDWVRAADEEFAQGSVEWVSDPFPDRGASSEL